MPSLNADKTRLGTIVIAVFALIGGGCASDGSTASSDSKKSTASAKSGQTGPRTSGNIADGEFYSGAWLSSRGIEDVDPALLPERNAPVVRNSRGVPFGESGKTPTPDQPASALPPPAPLGAAATNGPVPPLPSEVASEHAAGVWSLVVATFTEGNTIEAAQRMISETAKVAPDIHDLRVHPTAKGSMVVFGEYKGRNDAKAAEDRKWLKSIKYGDRPLFSSVMVAHLDLRPLQADLHPWDLHMARREHPKINPLYTLDIAVWDDFESGTLTYDEIRRSAERYVKQLRAQGFDAYFFHDDVAQRSMVTVGLFDKRAINEVSGLYSDMVVEYVRNFPQRLANGEVQYDYKDRHRPAMGTKPLTPVLVLVPDM